MSYVEQGRGAHSGEEAMRTIIPKIESLDAFPETGIALMNVHLDQYLNPINLPLDRDHNYFPTGVIPKDATGNLLFAAAEVFVWTKADWEVESRKINTEERTYEEEADVLRTNGYEILPTNPLFIVGFKPRYVLSSPVSE